MITRFWIQLVSAVLTNGYLKGFFTGRIFTGTSKHICVPTLNCYSCPGALFACPIGAAQVAFSGGGGLDPSAPHTIKEKLVGILTGTPVLVIGFLTLIGALIGRSTCGWACPFGWLQDLINKIPTKKKFSGPAFLGYGKYVVLLVMVVLLPLLWVDKMGYSGPYFCEFVCPAGTLQGGILLPLLNPDLRGMLGKLFLWKISLLTIFLVLMVFIKRPFCNWVCPLGAFLAPFNRVSLWKLELDNNRCVHCKLCTKACPAGLDVEAEIDGHNCVRCLDCIKACPHHLIRISGPGTANSATTSSETATKPPETAH